MSRENQRTWAGGMGRRPWTALLAALAVAAALALAACGGGSGGTTPANPSVEATAPPEQSSGETTTAAGGAYGVAPGGETASPPPAPAVGEATGEATIVSVVQRGFRNLPDKAEVPAGPVTFTVRNEDGEDHQFIILRTDLPADDLPLTANRYTVDETASGLTVAGRLALIEGDGGTATLTVALPPGRYVLICNVPGHYSLGMHTEFRAH